MTKFTPGPWQTIRDNFISKRLLNQMPDCRIVNREVWDVAFCPPTDDDNGNANAALIAAAPCLYDACFGMAGRLFEYCDELTKDGRASESGNIRLIAETLRVAAAKANGAA